MLLKLLLMLCPPTVMQLLETLPMLPLLLLVLYIRIHLPLPVGGVDCSASGDGEGEVAPAATPPPTCWGCCLRGHTACVHSRILEPKG